MTSSSRSRIYFRLRRGTIQRILPRYTRVGDGRRSAVASQCLLPLPAEPGDLDLDLLRHSLDVLTRRRRRRCRRGDAELREPFRRRQQRRPAVVDVGQGRTS